MARKLSLIAGKFKFARSERAVEVWRISKHVVSITTITKPFVSIGLARSFFLAETETVVLFYAA